MRVFFSYGHDHKSESMVKRLWKDIQSTGRHTVFMDLAIPNGTEWRNTLRKEIHDSDIVLFFASEKSLSSDSVCKDEMNIAIFEKGSVIRAVSLEKNLHIPQNLSFKQYFDLSDWKEKQADPDFETWYQAKLAEILAFLDSDVIYDYQNEMEEIKQRFHPVLESKKKFELQASEYFGRKWLSEKVRGWQKNGNKNLLLITGGPGYGKSSFIAHEFMFDPDVNAVIFCEYDSQKMNNLDGIARSLIYQFAWHDEEYRKLLIQIIHENPESVSKKGRDLYDFFITDLITELIHGNRPAVYILVDGLDELKKDSDHTNPLASILAEESTKHGSQWLRYIVTSRPDAEVLDPMQPVIQLSAVDQLDFEDHTKENESDVNGYIEKTLAGKYRKEDIQKIAEKANGNFLYATKVCDALLDDLLTLEEVLTSEKGLSVFYAACMNRVFQTTRKKQDYRHALCALTYSPEPLPERTLINIMNWYEDDVQKFERVFLHYIVLHEERLSFFHKSFPDWLTSKEAGSYQLSSERAIHLLAKGCYKAYQKNKYEMNDYEYLYLLSFFEADEHRQTAQYRKVIQDFELAKLLLQKAEEKKNEFRYEDAETLAENALTIFKNAADPAPYFEDRMQNYLLLSDLRDRSGELDSFLHSSAEGTAFAKELLLQHCLKNEDLAKEKLGTMLLTYATALRQKDYFKESVDAADQAAALFEEVKNDGKRIHALYNAASASRMQFKKYAEAEGYYQKIWANPSFPTLKKTDPLQYLEVIFGRSFNFYSWGKYNDLYTTLAEAEQLLMEQPQLTTIAKIMMQYEYRECLKYYAKKEFELCIEHADRSMEATRKYYGQKTREVTSALNQKGNACWKLGRLEDATKCFEESVAIRVRDFGEVNTQTATSKRNLARVLEAYNTVQKNQEAERILLECLHVRKCIGNESYIGMAYVDLAECMEKRKDYPAAITYMEQALQYYLKKNENGNTIGTGRDLCKNYDIYGRCLYKNGDYAKAKPILQKALELQKVHFREGVANTEEMLRNIEERNSNDE